MREEGTSENPIPSLAKDLLASIQSRGGYSEQYHLSVQGFVLLVAFTENNKGIRKVCLSGIYCKKKIQPRYL